MGRAVHFEIHAVDPEGLVAFYRDLFGWTFNRWGDQPYWLAATGQGPGIDGAVVQRRGPRPEPGQAVNAFVVTVDVADLDATLAAATAVGGTLAVARQAVPGVGWLAYLSDPDGNLVGLMEADPTAS